ncbi:hypothetical protein OG589_12755 [Sphaerisporangium sp. NBC_01403]
MELNDSAAALSSAQPTLPIDRTTPQRRQAVLQRLGEYYGDPDPDRALAAAADELGEALGELEGVLAAGDGSVRLDDGGDLVISPLTAEDVPAEATALKAELTEMLPFAPIVSLLIELDTHRLPGLLYPRRRQAGPQPRAEAELDRGAAGPLGPVLPKLRRSDK